MSPRTPSDAAPPAPGRGTSTGDPVVSRSVDVAAPAGRVWDLVSDLPGMGRFSPENLGGRWVGHRQGPAVGAVFRGRNARGLRRWSTRATVVECEPGRVFAFEVTSLGLPVALWRYDVVPLGAGSRLTESWTDRRGVLLRRAGGLITGVPDRRAWAAQSIETTLRRVQALAEGTTVTLSDASPARTAGTDGPAAN